MSSPPSLRDSHEDPSLNHQPYLLESESTELQYETELECQPFFVHLPSLPRSQLDHLRQVGLLPNDNRTEENHDDDDNSQQQQHEHALDICLLYDAHERYLQQPYASKLKPSFVSLDSSRPWILYWTLHSLDLMDRLPTEEQLCATVHTLRACWQSLEWPVPSEWLEQDVLLRQVVADNNKNSNSSSNFGKNDNGDAHDTSLRLPAGGFGGGPGQLAHCATTYASVLTLCIIATTATTSTSSDNSQPKNKPAARLALELLQEIRLPLYVWFLSLLQRHPSSNNRGAFCMHHDGEVDVRAVYIVTCCATLLRIATPHLLHSADTSRYVRSCQTHEGGFGGEPWAEAHGGYTYCAVAALQLLGQLEESCDTDALLGWLARRQMAHEGGFQGRCNKLVDGCYSFWQGAALAIVSVLYGNLNDGERKNGETREEVSSRQATATESSLSSSPQSDPWLTSASSSSSSTPPHTLLFHQAALQRYILLCAQDVQGGLRDKPSKPRDFYHSCYNVSGLSVSLVVLVPKMMKKTTNIMATPSTVASRPRIPVLTFGRNVRNRF